jgi:hypothetical protein
MGTICTTCFNSEYLCFMEYCKGLGVFENKALWTIRSAKDTVTGGWRELHYKGPIIFLSTKYCQSDLIKDGQMGGTCSTNGSIRHAYNILVENPDISQWETIITVSKIILLHA